MRRDERPGEVGRPRRRLVTLPDGQHGILFADAVLPLTEEELRGLRDDIDRALGPRRPGPSETKEGR